MGVPCPHPVLHATPICSVIWPSLLPCWRVYRRHRVPPQQGTKSRTRSLHNPRKDDVWKNSHVTAPVKV